MMTVWEITQWLDAFASAVRDRDYLAAEQLFNPLVISFGTQAVLVGDLATLVAEQWQLTCPHTKGFRFRMTVIRQANEIGVVLSTWSTDEPKREGRSTIILSKVHGRLLCSHSHFSLNPTPEFG